MGAERGVNCGHVQALLTNIQQRHWEWLEDRRTDLEPGLFRYVTAFMASLDVKAALDVATSSVASKILSLIGVHGHVVAVSLAEMKDARGNACLENCETEFRYSKNAFGKERGGGFQCWVRAAKYVLWKAQERVEDQEVETRFRSEVRQ